MENLPKDIAVQIAKLVAQQADDPMEQLYNLRTSCTSMVNICNDQEVGRSIALDRVLRRGSWEPYYSEKYRNELIPRLAHVGNPRAYFYEGLRVVFIEQRSNKTPPLEMLDRAAANGDNAARYVLAIVLYRSSSGEGDDFKAKKLLRQVEGNQDCEKEVWKNFTSTRMLQAAMEIIRAMEFQRAVPHEWGCGLPRVAKPSPRYIPNYCNIPNCPQPIGWNGWEQWSHFCSENCRIEYECLRFFSFFW